MSLTWSMLEQLTSGGFDHVVDGIVGVLNSGSTKGGTAQGVTNVVGAAGAAGGMAGAVASAASASAGAAGAGMAPPTSANLMEGIEEQVRQRGGAPTGPAKPYGPPPPPDPAGDAEREAIKRAGSPTTVPESEMDKHRWGNGQYRERYYENPGYQESLAKNDLPPEGSVKHEHTFEDTFGPGERPGPRKPFFSEEQIKNAKPVGGKVAKIGTEYVVGKFGGDFSPLASAVGDAVDPGASALTEVAMRAINAAYSRLPDLPVDYLDGPNIPDTSAGDAAGGGYSGRDGYSGNSGTGGYSGYGSGSSGNPAEATQQTPQYPGYPGYPPGHVP
ncbi:hypothetical protein C8K30_10482 [Promicromonospora sp. AC04]|uniref:hypothetical protein n=1 Tax=Promicromonospora sp. AC04 TaxID=2135723 RepID=UPI000D42DBF4|nr:hypothetical protein [Promicromonospora sp. AC04]PUB27635.1 hypothetical protein C8K30_10482 [Promicromonospora sp. AC04]